MAASTASSPLTPHSGITASNTSTATKHAADAARGSSSRRARQTSSRPRRRRRRRQGRGRRRRWTRGYTGPTRTKDGWEARRRRKATAGRTNHSDGDSPTSSFINNPSSESHYQFLGIAPEADIEEIKAAYRRLSKEYHPDTTRLPLKSASEKFIRLREVYNVLSKEETRRFYDWTLAQEAESRRLQQLRSRLEDPYELDIQNYESVPDMVDRLGGKNMELSDQAMTALTFDIAIFIFSICCIIYALFFKEQY